MFFVVAFAALTISASAQGSQVQTDQNIRARARVQIDTEPQDVTIKMVPTTQQVTRNVAVSTAKPKPQPKRRVRYVPRTTTVTTGYTGVGTVAGQTVTGEVDIEIDSQQVSRIVDNRINPRLSSLENRVSDLEVDMDAVNGRIDRTNLAVNTLSGRVNQQGAILADYDARITHAENRDPGKTHRWINTILGGTGTFLGVYNLLKGGGNGKVNSPTPCYGKRCGNNGGGNNNTDGPIRVPNGPRTYTNYGSSTGSGTITLPTTSNTQPPVRQGNPIRIY